MPLTISDELLKSTGMEEREARIEIGCRLFEAGKLTLPQVSNWTGLTRLDVEQELLQRKIPVYRPTVMDLESDLQVFDELESAHASGDQ